MNIDTILETLHSNSKTFYNHFDYPAKKGIYCFRLVHSSELENFCSNDSNLYVGISKKSLNSRDIKTHFNSNRTGTSTLRRSLGAILKNKLNLTTLPRSSKRTKQDIYCYKFEYDGEERLTDWMKNNLLVGYCILEDVDYQSLRNLEEEVIKSLKPVLDLDRRTRHLNFYSLELDLLRGICQEEAKSNKN